MRLFLAFPLPPEIVGSVKAIQRQLPRKQLRLPESTHLTIKFFGDVDEAKVEGLKATLKTFAHQKFSLTLSSISAFPNLVRPRVLWVGIEPAAAVTDIHQKVETLLAASFPLDDNFAPHITLARVKEDIEPVVAEKIVAIKVEPKRFVLDRLILYKSVLTREGPIHTELLTIPLG